MITRNSRIGRLLVSLALAAVVGFVSLWLDGREDQPQVDGGPGVAILRDKALRYGFEPRTTPGQKQDGVVRAPIIPRTLRAPRPSDPASEVEAETDRFAALGVTPTPRPLPEDPRMRTAAQARRAMAPPYQVYSVQEGDTFASIAARFTIEERYLIANNVEFENPQALTSGQLLLIPAGNGLLHEVRYGQTLTDIADRYQVTVEAIVGFAANGLKFGGDITETQLLFIPGACLDCRTAGAADCIEIWLAADGKNSDGTELDLNEVDC